MQHSGSTCICRYISQLIRDSRACGWYHKFLDRILLLTRRPLNQEFLVAKLKSSLQTFCLVKCLCDKWPRKCSVCRSHNPFLSSFMTYHQVCNKSSTGCATCEAGTAWWSPSWALGFTPAFSGVNESRSLVFCRALFVLLFFYTWPFKCLLLRLTVSDDAFGIFTLILFRANIAFLV